MNLRAFWAACWAVVLLVFPVAISARSSPSEGRAYAVGEVLIRWRADTGIFPQVAEAQMRLRTRWRGVRVDSAPQLDIERWRVPRGRVAEVVAALNRDPAVEWAEPNYFVRLAMPDVRPRPLVWLLASLRLLPVQGRVVPNDPYYQNYAKRYLERLGVEQAWAMETGARDLVVAVIDTGIDCEHEDLTAACWRNPAEVVNGVDDDGNGYVDDVNGWNFYAESPDVQDVFYHGTHVAGIIAARLNNHRGMVGIAPNVQVMPLAIFSPQGVGTYYDLIRALLYAADKGADVINMSLGATSYSFGEALAVEYAYRRGAVLVAAAGNRASDRWFYPAAHPQVIGVAATDVNDRVAGFSNRGTYVSVAAPGVSIISTIPDDRYGVLSGTSMAAPHVSGLAALVRSRNRRLSPAEVQRIIESSAEDQVGPVNQDVPGWDPFYGYGRIHVARALQMTPADPSPPSPPPPQGPQLPWSPPCRDVLVNGDFEQGLTGWSADQVMLTTLTVYSGTQAVQLEADLAGTLTQTIPFPERPVRATFFMAVRIETMDGGEGATPEFPFDDWLEVRLRTAESTFVLARMGNTSDSVSYGLEWDEVLAILPGDVLRPFRGQAVQLNIHVGGDRDGLSTRFTVDATRLCVIMGQPQAFIPWVMGR